MAEPHLEHQNVKIKQLIDDYRMGRIVIPEFQRDYVWKKGKAPSNPVPLLLRPQLRFARECEGRPVKSKTGTKTKPKTTADSRSYCIQGPLLILLRPRQAPRR